MSHPQLQIALVRIIAFALLFIVCLAIDWLAWEWEQTWRQNWGGIL